MKPVSETKDWALEAAFKLWSREMKNKPAEEERARQFFTEFPLDSEWRKGIEERAALIRSSLSAAVPGEVEKVAAHAQMLVGKVVSFDAIGPHRRVFLAESLAEAALLLRAQAVRIEALEGILKWCITFPQSPNIASVCRGGLEQSR